MQAGTVRSDGTKERGAVARAAARAEALFRDPPGGDGPFEGPLHRLVEDLRQAPRRKEG